MGRFQQYLNEEYEMRIKAYGKSYDVFINPTQKEFRKEFRGEMIKFIADIRKKVVYVWDVNGPLHDPAWRQIKGGRLGSDVHKGHIVPGYATKGSSGKFIMDCSDGDRFLNDYIYNVNMEDFRRKWKWLNKYIDISEYFGNPEVLHLMTTNEAWGHQINGKRFEVLTIPPDRMRDTKELKLGSNGIRFTADNKNKTLYVWNSYQANHSDVWDEIISKGRTYSWDPNTKVLQGKAEKKGSRWVMNIWDDYKPKFHDKVEEINEAFKWVNKYININNFMELL